MKRWIFRILAVGLALALCTAAAAETAENVSYTMAEKLSKQLEAGSGFAGTATMTAAAVEGRESDAFTTLKPIALDWTYIGVNGDAQAGVGGEQRFVLTMAGSGAQQGSAEVSVQDGTVYFQSSLTGDSWYQFGAAGSLSPVLGGAAALGVSDVAELAQLGSALPSFLSFFTNMTGYFVGGNFAGLSDSMEQYTTKIDFWLEGYRQNVQMEAGGDGASLMKIEYRIPAAAVKAQLKQFLVDLMNNEALLAELTAMMPQDQAALYLSPSLQPYYFYAVNELPLNDDLYISRAVSFLGDTVELSISMPLYDSKSGDMTLQYTRSQTSEDMPFENNLRLSGEASSTELTYRTYETMTGSTVYQGTLRVENAAVDGVKPKTLWAAFDLSTASVTTKDLNGYETLNQDVKLSIAPGESDGETDAQAYIAVPKVDLALAMRFSSLSAKNAPTDMNVTLTLSGEDMAQVITAELTGTTTAKWTPEAFDTTQAVALAGLAADERGTLLSQAGIKAGLLFLPYVSLPQITSDTAE